jgi:hypothetical protein
MTIRMYFDPETYRHVRTEYRVRTQDDMTTGMVDPTADMAIAQVRGESFYTLTEKFDDFRKVGEVTLPHDYTLHYMIDGTNQAGFIAQWKIEVLQAGFNTPDIDSNLFRAGN